jgi:hypothetical protein
MLLPKRLLPVLLPLFLLLWSCNRQADTADSSKTQSLITQLETQVEQLASLGHDSINRMRLNLQAQLIHEQHVTDSLVQSVLQRALGTLDEFEGKRHMLLDTLNTQILRLKALEHDFAEGRLTRKEYEMFYAREEAFSETWLLGAEYMASRVHAQHMLLQTLTGSGEKSRSKQN